MTVTTPQRGPLRLPAEISTVVWRHLVQIRHNPEQLLEVAIQPILFVLLFGVVLAGQMGGTDGDYLGYVVPGLIVQAAVLVNARTAIGLHADVNSGLMQRLQTLPINRFAPLAGRIIADFLMLLWSLVILLAAAFVIGYRVNVAPTVGISVLAVVLAFAFCLSWVAILVGLVIRSAESVQAIAFGAMLPLTILSGAFVDTTTVPGWLRPSREWNPVSIAAQTIRELLAGADATVSLARLLTISAVVLVVCAPLAIRAFARER